MAHSEYRAANEPTSLGERLGALHRQLLADVPQVDRIGCALYDPDDDLLKTFVHSTLAGEALRGYEYKLSASRSLLDLARRGGRRLLPDIPAALEPHTAHSAWVIEEGYRTSLTIPMYGQGAFTGMLFFDSRRPNAFSGAEQRHLELLPPLNTLVEELDAALREPEPELNTESAPEAPSDVCLELSTLLENGDLAARDLAQKERQRLMACLGPRATTILSAIEVFDFPLALAELRLSDEMKETASQAIETDR